MHTWRMYTYMQCECELRGFRAHEGSSNEKPHYFLMHLLIDQSRKGSAPPTLRPPLPSVNHSRNNLMIGALVLLSRLPRRSLPTVRVGDYYDAARFGKSFPSSHAPFLRFCSLQYARTTKKAMGTCARYARKPEKDSTFMHSRENTCLSRDRATLLLDTKTTRAHESREKWSFTITRSSEKRIALLTRASFHSNAELPRRALRRVNTRPANIFAGIHEINREHSRGSSRFPLTRNVRLVSKIGEEGRGGNRLRRLLQMNVKLLAIEFFDCISRLWIKIVMCEPTRITLRNDINIYNLKKFHIYIKGFLIEEFPVKFPVEFQAERLIWIILLNVLHFITFIFIT